MKFFALLFLFLLAGLSYVGWSVATPYRDFAEPVFVDFPRGTGSGEMASILSKKGVVKDRWVFLAARALNRGKTLQAGEYRFERPASALDVVGRIARGDIFYMELLIPEGYNIFEVAQAVAKLGIISEAKFLEAARNPAAIHDLDMLPGGAQVAHKGCGAGVGGAVGSGGEDLAADVEC